MAVALVIGGTRRVGRWASEALLAAGYTVHATFRSRGQDAEACVADMAQAGYRLLISQLDCADEQAVERAAGAMAQEHGGLDMLVYCPGVSLAEKLMRTSGVDALHLVQSNVLGFHHCVRAAVPYLRLSPAGRIVNFISISTDSARAFRDMPLYSACKAMLASYTRSLARELAGDGITANSIALGITTLTPEGAAAYDPASLPAKRAVNGEDVAAALWQLTGPASGQLTGSVLNLSGGWGL
jgi:3-oxoacyl-[acyl-carrier protein] reductase